MSGLYEDHPFAATRRQMRDEKLGGYGKLTDHQRREWHADVYAWRRVFLDAPASMRTSPCDESGQHFDEALVAEAQRY